MSDEEQLEQLLVGLIDGIKQCSNLGEDVSDEEYTECVYEAYLNGMQLRGAITEILKEMRKSYGFVEADVEYWIKASELAEQKDEKDEQKDEDEIEIVNPLTPRENNLEVEVVNPLTPKKNVKVELVNELESGAAANSQKEVEVVNELESGTSAKADSQKPKRKRRTKAEILAEKLAAAQNTKASVKKSKVKA